MDRTPRAARRQTVRRTLLALAVMAIAGVAVRRRQRLGEAERRFDERFPARTT